MAPDGVGLEGALPAHAVVVGVDRVQGLLLPAPLAGRAVAHDRAQHVVAVAEDVRGDGHLVADAALDRLLPTVEGRGEVLDPDARRRLVPRRGGHVSALFP